MDAWKGQTMDMNLRYGEVKITTGLEAKEKCTISDQYGNVTIGSFFSPEYGEVKGPFENLLVAQDSGLEGGMEVSRKAEGEPEGNLTVTCRNGDIKVSE